MRSGTPKRKDPALRSSIAVLVAAGLAGALVLGAWIPSRWHIPMAMVIGVLAMAATSFKLNGLWRIQRNRVNRDLGNLRDELAQSQRILSDLRQLAITTNEGLARLEARAHNDEVRIRQVAQLAKKAAEHAEFLATRAEAAPAGGNRNFPQSRPEVSQVRPTSGTKHIGRLAASVSPDSDRSRKIHQAIEYGNSQDSTTPVAAVIGTQRLATFLEMQGTIPELLVPGYAVSRLTALAPVTVVVEEAAFGEGAWFGANSSHGTVLFEELCEIARVAKLRGIPIYVIRARRRTDVYSAEIRQLCDYSFPSQEFKIEWGVDADLGIMRHLQNYAVPEKNMELK